MAQPGSLKDREFSKFVESPDRPGQSATEISGNIKDITGTVSLPTGASTLAEQQTQSQRIGSLSETAPATDTASSGLNGRLQRIAQRITSLITSITDGTQQSRIRGGTNGTIIGNTQDRLNTIIKFDKNSTTTDSSGIARFTSIKQIFGYSFSQTLHPLSMRNKLDNGATVTLDTLTASAVLTATPTSGSRAQFESKFIVRYLPGRAHLVTVSATPGAGILGYGKRWGYYSDTNGYFFEQLDNEQFLRVALRSNAAGVTSFSLPQSFWNLDKLDGTGPSGVTLDITKSAVFIIEYTWHGNGTIRWGVQYNKDIIYVHELMADNQSTDVLTRNPSQPVKMEVFRTGLGSPAENAVLKIHALSANIFYIGVIEPTYSFSASRGISPVTVRNNAWLPIISIRASLLFNGRINRTIITPKSARFFSSSGPLHIQVVADANLVGASWAPVGNGSSAERDISATSYTGGVVVYEDYISSGTVDDYIFTRFNSPESENFVLGLSVDGNVADTLTIVARSLTNNSVSYASIYWGEFQS